MNEPLLLRWAAGGPHPVPADVEFDEEVLLTGVQRHRLAARFVARAERERPPWLRPSLLDAVRAEKRDAEVLLARRTAQIAEVLQTGRPDEDVIVLKGVTALLLTGDAGAVRMSNDLDLIAEDPDRLVERLVSVGYEHADDPRRGHEFASLDKDALNADVHSYWPVAYLDPDTDLRDLVSLQRPERDVRLQAMPESRIEFAVLHTNSVNAPLNGVSVRVADPTLAAFLLCCHCFREYCHTPFLKLYATIRLSELCDIAALRRCPDFDWTRFRALEDRYCARTSVAFVAYLLKNVFDDDSGFAREGARNEVPLFPYDLWLEGFVIADNRAAEPDALLLRPALITFADHVDRLSPSHVVASTDGQSERLGTHDEVGAVALRRVFVHGGGRDVTADFEWSPDALTLTLDVRDGARAPIEVLLDLGNVRYQLTADPAAEQIGVSWRRNMHLDTRAGRQWRVPLDLRIEPLPGATRISAGFPWEALGGNPLSASLPIVLGARTHGPSGVPGDGVVIPLVVERG